jgi:hypothetical protein
MFSECVFAVFVGAVCSAQCASHQVGVDRQGQSRFLVICCFHIVNSHGGHSNVFCDATIAQC